MKTKKSWLILAICSMLLTNCSTDNVNQDTNVTTSAVSLKTAATTDNSSLLFGNPSNATTANNNNYLVEKKGYSLSYNNSRGTTNWTSWHLFNQDIGSTGRTNDFRSDNSLPATFFKAQPSDYVGSGFDRGHLCPSGDRTTSTTSNSETFLMTNMMPQAPKNNQKTWEGLESYARTLVNNGKKEVYIIAGCYGTGGVGSKGGTTNTLANGKITVPSNVWKVVLVIDNGNNDLSRVTNSTRVIAVNMPNTEIINTNWKTYRVSVRSIEAATGYNILSQLPISIQDAIETKVDNL